MVPEIVARELADPLEDPERQAPAIDYLDALRRDVGTVGYREPPIVTALKDVAVPALLTLLERDDADHDVLANALGMLGHHDDRVFDKLVELLGHDDRAVRLSAPAGLAFFGDRAVPHLEKLLAKDVESAKDLHAAGTPRLACWLFRQRRITPATAGAAGQDPACREADLHRWTVSRTLEIYAGLPCVRSVPGSHLDLATGRVLSGGALRL